MFKNSHIISGISAWKALSHRIIDNRIITIRDVDDYYINPNFSPSEFRSVFVKVENCHKNFIFCNLRPFLFPNIRFLYIKCHPCSIETLREWDRLSGENFVGVLHPDYENFLKDYNKKYKNNKWIVCEYE
jgi:hypothetical protein